MILNTITGEYPVSLDQIKSDQPNVSLPSLLAETDLLALGYATVFHTDKPTFDPLTKQLAEGAPTQTQNGWVQTWIVTDLPAEVVAANQAAKALQDREKAKAQRTSAVANIVVTTSTGRQFDGDETSQTRMSRAIVGMKAVGAATINWVLHDNTTSAVTVAELAEAMVLAGEQQSSLWVI